MSAGFLLSAAVTGTSLWSAHELTKHLCRESLPQAKQAEVTDFTRFLLDRESDECWESIVAQRKPRPRFESFLRDGVAESAEPLDPKLL
jgi:hypothetical protein